MCSWTRKPSTLTPHPSPPNPQPSPPTPEPPTPTIPLSPLSTLHLHSLFHTHTHTHTHQGWSTYSWTRKWPPPTARRSPPNPQPETRNEKGLFLMCEVPLWSSSEAPDPSHLNPETVNPEPETRNYGEHGVVGFVGEGGGRERGGGGGGGVHAQRVIEERGGAMQSTEGENPKPQTTNPKPQTLNIKS